MRTFLIILGILAAAIIGVAVYLVVTTPGDAEPLKFPLTEAQLQLLGHVPPDAEAYALVPSPVVLMRRLLENPVTRDPVTKWTDEHPLPPASMLGRADAVVWRSGKTTSYAVRFDPVRALIVRTWTMFASVDARWQGRTLILNPAGPVTGSGPPPEVSAASGLPEGDAFVVQRRESRGAHPPIGRPTLTSISITGKEISITSRAAGKENDQDGGMKPALRIELPRSAMLSVSFADPPRVLGDLDRLLAADIDALVGSGGTIAVYGVDTGTLLPRPFAAVVVPANEESRAAIAKYDHVLASLGRVEEADGQLIVSFDRNSAAAYRKDARTPMPWTANRWALRMDPAKLIPVLRKVGDNPALRFATPRIHRGARDLRRWMGALEQAETVEAASSVEAGYEELRVRVASK
jgi:hypothetical protein